MFSNYGALDLSNDEAQHASHDTDETSPPPPGPQTFSGSVTRENSMDQVGESILFEYFLVSCMMYCTCRLNQKLYFCDF